MRQRRQMDAAEFLNKNSEYYRIKDVMLPEFLFLRILIQVRYKTREFHFIKEFFKIQSSKLEFA